MRIFLPMIALISVLAMAGNVGAQSANSSSGTFGSRSLGSSLSAGQRTFGSNPTSGSRTTADLGSVGQIDSGDRFLRNNRQQGQFVGSSSQDLQNFVGAMQGNQRANQQNRGGPASNRSGGANRPGSTNRSQTARAGKGEIRTRLRVGFSYEKGRSTELGTQLAERLMKIPQFDSLAPLEIRVAGGTATLRGTVATDHDRDLVVQWVRLEPGIWKVQNELAVARVSDEPKPPVSDTRPESLPKKKPAGRSAGPPSVDPFLGGLFRAKGPEPKGPVADSPVLSLPEEPMIVPELVPAD